MKILQAENVCSPEAINLYNHAITKLGHFRAGIYKIFENINMFNDAPSKRVIALSVRLSLAVHVPRVHTSVLTEVIRFQNLLSQFRQNFF